MAWIGRGSMRATLRGRQRRREQLRRFESDCALRLITTARESDSVSRVSEIADQLPADIETLHALLMTARAERDAAIAERDHALSQNDRLRHLLRQLQRAQFGRRSEKLDRGPAASGARGYRAGDCRQTRPTTTRRTQGRTGARREAPRQSRCASRSSAARAM